MQYALEVPAEVGLSVWAVFLTEADRLRDAASALRADQPDLAERLSVGERHFRRMAEALRLQAVDHVASR